MCGRYHKQMRGKALLMALLAAFLPRALAQNALPDLGSGEAVMSPSMERRIGESIMRDIRRDPSYVDDPEIIDYLQTIGGRLAQEAPGARQDFEFFALRDPAINAFALPGGFVCVNTGLLVLAETESELASVLGHEISHVTQRHVARMIGQQQQMQLPVLAAVAAAILLGRSRPDLAAGATAAVQGAAVQAQLSYSRDFEREADRFGMQALSRAGYDPNAMAAFFEKMQRATRVGDDGGVPGYLRTHPLTPERIADAQNRAASLPYKQHLDNPDFQLVRAKVSADGGDPLDALAHFESALRDGRYASQTAARYGLAEALLRVRRPREADAEVTRLRKAGAADPMIETLAARVKQALGDKDAAAALLAQARVRYPYSRPVLYAHVAALLEAGRSQEALAQLGDAVRVYPRDPHLLALQSRTYEALGKRLLHHQTQAEYYVLQGSLPAAIEQLQLARSAGDGDFYQLSVIDARLKDLRAQHSQEMKDQKR
jgi:predicted Zn-dependent protease